MGAKAEALAKQFEAKVREAAAVLEKLSAADWKKTTAAEKWTVGVTAHHIAAAYEAVAHFITTIASGQALPHFTMQMIDEMNAKHAVEFAGCTKAETIALHTKGAAATAAVVRALSDEELARTGVVFAGAPAMSSEQLIMLGLINHIDEHFGSIQKTVGG